MQLQQASTVISEAQGSMIAVLRCKCICMLLSKYARSPKAHLLTQSRMVQVLPSLRLLLLHLHGR